MGFDKLTDGGQKSVWSTIWKLAHMMGERRFVCEMLVR